MGAGQQVVLLLLGSYLFGSLPFGLWIARRWSGVDIRTIGSGNIGSTNVARACGPVAAAIVFLLDFTKGAAPPLIGHGLQMQPAWQVLSALLGIVGHNYSIWLRFKGGKGIATGAGALVGIAPPVALCAITVFGLELITLNFVSLGSLLGATCAPALIPLFYPGDPYRMAFAVAGWLLVVYKHRANIARLRSGNEPRVRMPWSSRQAV